MCLGASRPVGGRIATRCLTRAQAPRYLLSLGASLQTRIAVWLLVRRASSSRAGPDSDHLGTAAANRLAHAGALRGKVESRAAGVTIQDLGSLGELVAAIATVATLVYLAIQIRQNTRTVRTSTYQAVLESSNRVNELVLDNPELHRIYRSGRTDRSQLTDEERARFRLLIGQLMNVYETMFLQYERGTLDQDFWRGRSLALRYVLSQPGIRSHLKEQRIRKQRGARVASFEQLIDSFLNEPPLERGPAA